MNLFLILFALFYFAEHGVAYWLTFLNLKHVRQHENEVPSYFRDKISLEDYQKSIRYTRDKTRLEVVSSAVAIPIFWTLLLSGFFPKVDHWARSFGYPPVGTGLVFFAAMSALFYVISLPFSLYSTFVIEQKYGFNKMTLKLWVIDLAKGLMLSVLIGVPVLSAVLWFMDNYLNGPWWLYVWAVLALFQLFVMAVFPVFIVPIFNKLTPLEEGSLRERIHALAWKVKFKMSGIFTMDGSKRSTHSNAFFAGIGKFRRIVLFDTLMKSLSELELVAVLAHEMGHNKKKHLRTGLIVGLGSSLLGLYILSLIIKAPWLYQAFGFDIASSYAALFIFMKASGSFTFFLEPLFSLLSRKHEYEADRFAAEAVGTPEPMIQGLVKLTKDNLSNLTPHPLYSFFYYSHPTVMERIAALESARSKG
jgi:STE24 endopeptidase